MKNKYILLSRLKKLKLSGYKYINKIDIINKTTKNLPNIDNELNNIINNCNLCQLSKYSNTKIPFFNNLNSKIVILVPKSLDNIYLKLLSNILFDNLNIDINNVSIINILKCKVDNVELIDDYYKVCSDYTIKQLELISPKFIISFGDIYKYIIDTKLNIGEYVIYNKSKLFYLEDLGFLLRNPSTKDIVKNNFYKIKLEMEKN